MPINSTSAVTFSRGIIRTPHLSSFLAIHKISRKYSLLPGTPKKDRSEVVIAWGLKPNTTTAKKYAQTNNLHYLILEDGFLRSIGLGVNHAPPLSLVIDDLGIYYNADQPSRLESILNNDWDNLPPLPSFTKLSEYAKEGQDPLNSETLISRAQKCIKDIIENRLSKYNSSPDITLKPTTKKRILIVDQTAGDLSIRHGHARGESFIQMLNAAIAEHPDAEILVKMHPDVIAGKKQGHLSQTKQYSQIHFLTTNCNPIKLIQQVDHVYVVTSQLGFEALMAGKTVTCFGAPFYAGWGVTDDRIKITRRKQKRTIEQLVAAAYILYAHYRDPETGEPCEIERVINHLALQRHLFVKNSGTLFCYGFSLWKRGYIRNYLHSPWNNIQFIRNTRQIKRRLPHKDARIVVWGTCENKKLKDLAKSHQIPIWRMEDGFLRSVGLGSDFTAPASLVLDKQGIYFDPAQPSDLETILNNNNFTVDEIHRAKTIRKMLLNGGISKYNMGEKRALEHSARANQQIILVPGQVEDDASIRLGCQAINTNESLLQFVRKEFPDAYIIYKPHPDVLSGNRKGKKKYRQPYHFDQLITDINISHCLDAVDEIHTMTSLVGFEGLLRGKKVFTYGLPFYAGWGLTQDRMKLARRRRTLNINELIAGCMVSYPRYVNNESKAFSSPEMVIDILKRQQSTNMSKTQINIPKATRMARKLINLIKCLTHGK